MKTYTLAILAILLMGAIFADVYHPINVLLYSEEGYPLNATEAMAIFNGSESGQFITDGDSANFKVIFNNGLVKTGNNVSWFNCSGEFNSAIIEPFFYEGINYTEFDAIGFIVASDQHRTYLSEWNATDWDFQPDIFKINTDSTCANETLYIGELYITSESPPDETAPELVLIAPENITYTNFSYEDNGTRYGEIPFNFTAGDAVRCFLKFDGTSYEENEIPDCANGSIYLESGPHSFGIFVNDSAGNSNETEVYFTLIVPSNPAPQAPVILSPENETYNLSTLDLNYTVDETAYNCWYFLNGGEPIDLISCINGTFTPAFGANSLQVAVNSLSSNETNISETVYFTSIYEEPENETAPELEITIISPVNETYNLTNETPNLALNFTLNDSASWCWYKLDGKAWVNLTNCENTTLYNVSNGAHNLSIRGELGGVNSTASVQFSVIGSTVQMWAGLYVIGAILIIGALLLDRR